MHSENSTERQAYFERVWAFVRLVPSGYVVTYGQIAQSITAPAAEEVDSSGSSLAQWVGSALASCPKDVPWHRVINAQAKVSSRPGAAQQQALLQAEGVVLLRGRVDLNVYQWCDSQKERHSPTQQRLF